MLAQRISVALLLIFGFILAAFALLLAVPIVTNEITARSWAGQYLEMSHPVGTERLAVSYGIYKWSNGNHCDFGYLEARAYDPEDRAEIESFYGGLDHLDNLKQLHPDFRQWSSGTMEEIPIYREFGAALKKLPAAPYYTLEGYGLLGDDIRCF